MEKTYRAVEITKPGTFHLVERPVVAPGEGQVRIRVEACGVCHSDAGTVEGQLPGVVYPRVPGHEAIGRIEEVGRGVPTWQVGQRVGVGFFGGEDGTCETCRRGDTAYCQNPIITGVTSDGGYAEVMIAEARALALIPDELKSEDAAPLVCAGITTFNALRNAGRASVAPTARVQARKVKPRGCISFRSADLGSWDAESARYVCEIFISFSLVIIVFS